MKPIKIGIVGDFCSDNPTHLATSHALAHAADRLEVSILAEWLPTDDPALLSRVKGCDAIWISPGSPYNCMESALDAIQYARENDLPLIGTCGGFQHIVVEFARNVLGLKEAQHAEYAPDASTLFISKLACSLVGQQLPVYLDPASCAYSYYGDQSEVTEDYYCNFGLNEDHKSALSDAGLNISGTGADGEARVAELPKLRFFVGTLFVPQIRSTVQSPHPLVVSFVEAACAIPATA